MTIQPSAAPPTVYSDTPRCLVCGHSLDLRQSQGRRSRKPSLTFVCPVDGRHFRAFITYLPYVEAVLERLKGQEAANQAEGDVDNDPTPSRRSKTNLERAS